MRVTMPLNVDGCRFAETRGGMTGAAINAAAVAGECFARVSDAGGVRRLEGSGNDLLNEAIGRSMAVVAAFGTAVRRG